ncbi:MAG: 16S rRNA (guanine(527)-N(7))-methyltransferase RsmG [Actinomycetota bacterium]
MKHEGWALQAAALGVELDARAEERLSLFEELLVERAAPRGMISKGDVPRVRERHVLDCLRVVPQIGPGDRRLCDLGSGAGLPGLVVACTRPDLEVVLTEVRRNRAAFLGSAIEELELPRVTVWARRVETLRERFDVCTARAFADPRRSWAVAERLLGTSGRMIYWAGERYDERADPPEGVDTTVFETSALARAGALVIISRQ